MGVGSSCFCSSEAAVDEERVTVAAEVDDWDTHIAAAEPGLASPLPDDGFASSTSSMSLSSEAASEDDGWFSTTGVLSAEVVAASPSAASSALGSPESHGPK